MQPIKIFYDLCIDKIAVSTLNRLLNTSLQTIQNHCN